MLTQIHGKIDVRTKGRERGKKTPNHLDTHVYGKNSNPSKASRCKPIWRAHSRQVTGNPVVMIIINSSIALIWMRLYHDNCSILNVLASHDPNCVGGMYRRVKDDSTEILIGSDTGHAPRVCDWLGTVCSLVLRFSNFEPFSFSGGTSHPINTALDLDFGD
jgi:hypothetical protein